MEEVSFKNWKNLQKLSKKMGERISKFSSYVEFFRLYNVLLFKKTSYRPDKI